MTQSSISLFAATYIAVFVAELVGDKTLYTLSSLATSFRPLPVFIGASVAFMLKAAAAVLLGAALGRLPASVVTGLSVATFAAMAIGFWRRRTVRPVEQGDQKRWTQPFLLAFGSIFLSEWADAGQLTAAALAAQSGRPAVVWLGVILALSTKGLIGVTVGVGLRRWVRAETLRIAAIATFIVLGALALFRVEL